MTKSADPAIWLARGDIELVRLPCQARRSASISSWRRWATDDSPAHSDLGYLIESACLGTMAKGNSSASFTRTFTSTARISLHNFETSRRATE